MRNTIVNVALCLFLAVGCTVEPTAVHGETAQAVEAGPGCPKCHGAAASEERPTRSTSNISNTKELEILMEAADQQLVCEILSGSRVHCRWFPEGEVCSIICDPDGNCTTYCYSAFAERPLSDSEVRDIACDLEAGTVIHDGHVGAIWNACAHYPDGGFGCCVFDDDGSACCVRCYGNSCQSGCSDGPLLN